jgi:hypothetical protein
MAKLIMVSFDELNLYTPGSIKLHDPAVKQKIVGLASMFGQLQAPVIYADPDSSGKYKILKGRSIAQALKDSGEQYIYCFLLEPMASAALHLCNAGLNTLQQRIDSVEMAYAIHDLLKVYSKHELVLMLNYSMEELSAFEQLFDYEWNRIKKKKNENQAKLF